MNKKLKAVGLLLALGLSFPTITHPVTSFAAETNPTTNAGITSNVNTVSTRFYQINESNNEFGSHRK